MRPFTVLLTGLMALVGMLALDLWVLRSLGPLVTLSGRLGLAGVLPFANLLAALLLVLTYRLLSRGEVGLAPVAFLVVGGATILTTLYVLLLAPDVFQDYYDMLARPLEQLIVSPETRRQIEEGRMGHLIYNDFVGGFLASILLTPLLLLPGMAAWTLARGHRLRLLPSRAASDEGSP